MNKKIVIGSAAICIAVTAVGVFYAQSQVASVETAHANAPVTATVEKPKDNSELYEHIATKLKKTEHDVVVVQVFPDGYLEKHGDHYHFVKGAVPQDAVISLLPAHNLTSSSDDYTFNPADIVEENEYGYVLRHGDHYHFIFKSQTSNNAALQTVHEHAHEEDPFVFDPKNIVAETSTGYIVQHGNHTHFVPKASAPQLSEHVEKPQNQPHAHTNQASPDQTAAEQKRQAKIKELIERHQLDPNTIRIEGDDLIYPHGDHYHSLSLLDDSPSHDHHAHENERIGMQTLEKMGLHPELIHSLIHASTHDGSSFPSDETDPEKMIKFLAKVSSINVGQIEHPFEMSGYQYLTNLETLAAGFTPITNEELATAFQRYPHLKQVKRLWLTRTGIQDYSFTREMPNLIGLDISSNGVTDFSFIKDLRLTELAAADSTIRDLSFLRGTAIRHLNLDYNEISDVSDLRMLPLEVLSIENNALTNANGLSGNQTLTRLFIGNSAENARTIDLKQMDLPNLRELTAQHIGLKQLADLALLKNVTAIDISHNLLENLSGIGQLSKLETLTVNANQLNTMQSLGQLNSVMTIHAANNNLKDLSLLSTNDSIKQLDVSHNKIERLDGIGSFKQLEYLKIDHNLLESFKATDPSASLAYISAKHNRLNSWDGLHEHANLSGGDVQEGNQLPPYPGRPTATDEAHPVDSDSDTTHTNNTRAQSADETEHKHNIVDKARAEEKLEHGHERTTEHIDDVERTQPTDEAHLEHVEH